MATSRPLALAAMALATAVAPRTAAAATCHVIERGAQVRLDLADVDDEAWAPWCARLAPYIVPPGTTAKVAPADARRAEERLAKLGYFREISCHAEAAALACQLVPEPIVTQAEIVGPLPWALLRGDLRRRLFLRPGTLLPRPQEMLKQQEQRLTKTLVSDGYLDAKASLRPRPTGQVVPNLGIAIDAVVDIGPAFAVRTISVIGDVVIGQTVVEEIFRPAFFLGLGSGRFRPSLLTDQARALEERLQEAGYPAAAVRPKVKRVAGQPLVDLRVHVHAGPWLKVIFRGNRALSNRALRRALTFADAGAIDALEVEHSRLAIVTAYQRRGYDQAAVTLDTQPGDTPTTVRFVVDEGPRRFLSRVTVDAPEGADGAALQAGLRTRVAGLGGYVWVDEDVAADRDQIADHLRSGGFTEVAVDAERARDPALPHRGDRFAAHFRISATPPQRVQERLVTGLPADVDQGRLLADLRQRPGGPLVAGQAEEDASRLESLLVGEGYLQAEVGAEVTVLPDTTGSLAHRVILRVRAGRRARFAGLFVRGRVRSKLDVVEDEIPLTLGEPLVARATSRAASRLRSFNIFSSVDITPLPAEAGDSNTMVLAALQEREELTVDARSSFSTDDRFDIGASLGDRNLFGRAVNLSLNLRLADSSDWARRHTGVPLRIGNRDVLALRLGVPRPFSVPFDLQFDAQAEHRDYPGLYTYANRGGSLAILRTLVERGPCRYCPQVVGRLAYELNSASLDKHSDRKLSLLIDRAATIARLAPSITVEGRDSALDPHRGYSLSSRFDLAVPALSGPLPDKAVPFWSFSQRAQAYWPIIDGPGGPDTAPERLWGGPLVFAASGSFFAAGHLTDNPRGLPTAETFAYGGDIGVRGLRLRATDVLFSGGQQPLFMTILNAELRWYLIRAGIGTIQLAGFLDFGSVAARVGELGDAWTVAAGPALRYVTVVGPLTLAYGHLLSAPSALRAAADVAPARGRLHFMFGYSF